MTGLARALAAVAAAAAVVASCGRGREGPSAPRPAVPPLVEAVFPPPRGAGVAYDTEIWARFARPLDPATVDSTRVYLKVDTRRAAVAVAWDDTARAIRVEPRRALALAETYTVELRPGLATVDGERLEAAYSWQFTVTGVRAPRNPIPAPGTGGESPFVPLSWEGTETAAGEVLYDLYAGADSTAVAARALAPLARTASPHHLPATRWSLGADVFWSVTTLNRTTGEALAGPVWRFRTLESGAPIDSVEIAASQWGYHNRSTRQSLCFEATLLSGANYNCAVGWDAARLATLRPLAGVRVTVTTQVSSPPPSALWSTRDVVDARACILGFPGPPHADRQLADGRVTEPFVVVYASDVLVGHLAGAQRGIGVFGHALVSGSTIRYGAPPRLTVYVFR